MHWQIAMQSCYQDKLIQIASFFGADLLPKTNLLVIFPATALCSPCNLSSLWPLLKCKNWRQGAKLKVKQWHLGDVWTTPCLPSCLNLLLSRNLIMCSNQSTIPLHKLACWIWMNLTARKHTRALHSLLRLPYLLSGHHPSKACWCTRTTVANLHENDRPCENGIGRTWQ